MSPRASINDKVYGLIPEPEVSSYGGLAFAVGRSCSDLAYGLGGQLFSIPAGGNRIADVSSMRGPLKITNRVIERIMVFVRNFWKIMGIGDKCFSYQPRKKDGFLDPVFAKNSMPVASFIRGKGKHLSAPQCFGLARLVGDIAVNPSNSTKIRNLVESFIPYHCQPSLAGLAVGNHAVTPAVSSNRLYGMFTHNASYKE